MDVKTLKAQFNGEIITPKDAAYALARKTYVTVGSPKFILHPMSNKDVATAIQFGRDNNLPIAVRSGGHSVVGFSTNSGGLVIDLSAMNQVKLVDKAKHLVQVDGGALWGDIAKQLQKHNLAISSGDTRSVGVGGLTLNGGIGWMVRKYGLTIDQLVKAEVVTADGQVRQASSIENPDLFWAIRGGGGNFGVVTQFTFQAHPCNKVVFGRLMYSLDNLKQTLTKWQQAAFINDENLTSSITIMPAFGDMPPGIMVLFCYDGTLAEAKKAIAPFSKLGELRSEEIAEKDYADVLEEANPPPNVKAVAKNILAKLNNDLIDAIVASTKEPGMRVIQIRALGGAVKRVPAETTAFAYRDADIMMFVGAFVPVEATPKMEEEALKPWLPIAKFGTGAYANFISTNVPADLDAIFPKATYERLVKVKQKYDPDNIFQLNFNIKPLK